MVDRMAQRYSMSPRAVMQEDFNTLIVLADYWGEEQRYSDRYRDAEKRIEESRKKA